MKLMSADDFLDTNILVYAVLDEGPKVKVAQELIASGCILGVQVLNEFAAVARRKFGKQWNEIVQALGIIRDLSGDVVPITTETHDRALTIAARYGFGFYDALIIASAANAGCTTLYSEDMQTGQVIEGVTVLNPFVADA